MDRLRVLGEIVPEHANNSYEKRPHAARVMEGLLGILEMGMRIALEGVMVRESSRDDRLGDYLLGVDD